jgi:tungstate transport system permease protein
LEGLAESGRAALELIVSLDPDIVSAASTSLAVAACSIALAALPAIPAGLAVGLLDFPGKRAVVLLLNSLTAVPTVLVGLLVYMLISRRGPLGGLDLLFTPSAIVLGGILLAGPIVATLVMNAAEGADPRILPTARTLGAGPLRAWLKFAAEIRPGIVAALVSGFGRVISEVGVAMMLGGNIRGYTRTMTTAIALETGKGEFALGIGLGLVLMAVALLVNVLFNLLRERSQS